MNKCQNKQLQYNHLNNTYLTCETTTTTKKNNNNIHPENRSSRLNLVFHGIDDVNHSETWIHSENLVDSICKAKMVIELKSIQWAHHVGRYTDKFNRSILAVLAPYIYTEKEDVLSNVGYPTVWIMIIHLRPDIYESVCGNAQ